MAIKAKENQEEEELRQQEEEEEEIPPAMAIPEKQLRQNAAQDEERLPPTATLEHEQPQLRRLNPAPPPPHALVVAFPVPSHLNPLLQLARKLARHGFLISTVTTDHASSAHSSANSSLFRSFSVPDGLPASHPRSSFHDQLLSASGMLPPLQLLLRRLQSSYPPVSCLIADVFLPWSHDLASQFSIPRFAFFTSNATACCVMSHARHLLSSGIIPFEANGFSDHLITCIPGAPPLRPSEFPPSMQTDDISFYRFQFTLKIFEHIEQAAGLLLNSFYELETKAVNAMQLKVPVYTVGPLLLPNGDEALTTQQEVSFWDVEDRCLNWLDAQPASSVLYVSFGSLSTFSDDEQMKELALGLEASQQPFLWVIRQDAVHGSLSEGLPEGFLDRTRDRSLIISWAPQLLVLQHPAVGGFLSHCGWNSILENIAIGGVPMLCWPDIAEQKVNCRLLVDDWKMGLEFQRRDDGKVAKEEVERVVRALMQGEEGRERRNKATELKNEANKVVKEGGSSFRSLEALVKSIRERVSYTNV